jgi:hypothetical protein
MTPLATGGWCQWHSWPVVGSINETSDQWWAMSMTQLTNGQQCRSITFWLDTDSHSEISSAGSDLNLTLSHSGSANQWWAVSMMPLTGGGRCQWLCWPGVGRVNEPLTSGSGVNDTADQWWAVSMTLLTKYDTAYQWASKFDMRWMLLKRISKFGVT